MMLSNFLNDNFANEFFGDAFSPLTTYNYDSASQVRMPVDIQEFKDRFEISVDLPGYEKSDIAVELEEGYLTISAKNARKEGEKEGRYIRKERRFGDNHRSFYVGEEVTQEDIKARFARGVLTVKVAKKQPEPKVEQNRYILIG